MLVGSHNHPTTYWARWRRNDPTRWRPGSNGGEYPLWGLLGPGFWPAAQVRQVGVFALRPGRTKPLGRLALCASLFLFFRPHRFGCFSLTFCQGHLARSGHVNPFVMSDGENPCRDARMVPGRLASHRVWSSRSNRRSLGPYSVAPRRSVTAISWCGALPLTSRSCMTDRDRAPCGSPRLEASSTWRCILSRETGWCASGSPVSVMVRPSLPGVCRP